MIAAFQCRRCGTRYEGWIPNPPFERRPEDPLPPTCPVCPGPTDRVPNKTIWTVKGANPVPRRF